MKKQPPKTGIVPSQEDGMHTSVEAHAECSSREEAIALYQEARRRLLDINHWDEYAGFGDTFFSLTDASGNLVGHSPEMGDLIRIKSGNGYEWVMIEEYIETIDRKRDNDLFAFRVRPVDNPETRRDNGSALYREEATSTFLLQRAGTRITTAEKGRNEIPDTSADGHGEMIRNSAASIVDSLGISVDQWKALMEGLLRRD